MRPPRGPRPHEPAGQAGDNPVLHRRRPARLIITRDRHIQDHYAEIEAVRASSARMVNITGAEALDTFHQLEALMCQWQKVYALLHTPGPFIFTLTRTTLRPLPLRP